MATITTTIQKTVAVAATVTRTTNERRKKAAASTKLKLKMRMKRNLKLMMKMKIKSILMMSGATGGHVPLTASLLASLLTISTICHIIAVLSLKK